MGMFDDVTDVPEVKCRKCGAPVTGWQSKDGPCMLAPVPFWAVRNFYASCAECDEWHEFVLKRPVKYDLSDYELMEPDDDSDEG